MRTVAYLWRNRVKVVNLPPTQRLDSARGSAWHPETRRYVNAQAKNSGMHRQRVMSTQRPIVWAREQDGRVAR